MVVQDDLRLFWTSLTPYTAWKHFCSSQKAFCSIVNKSAARYSFRINFCRKHHFWIKTKKKIVWKTMCPGGTPQCKKSPRIGSIGVPSNRPAVLLSGTSRYPYSVNKYIILQVVSFGNLFLKQSQDFWWILYRSEWLNKCDASASISMVRFYWSCFHVNN